MAIDAKIQQLGDYSVSDTSQSLLPTKSLSGNDVWAKLHYYVPPTDGSEPVFVTDKAGSGTKNYTHEGHLVFIRDIRQTRDKFTLAENSFTAISGISPLLGPITDEDDGWRSQTKEVLLQNIPGSEKAVIFDFLVRRAIPNETLSRPVRKVHVDQTPQAAWQRARQHLDDADYERATSGKLRLRIINVWRSIDQTVIGHPLVFADSSTVEDNDLVKVHRIFPGREGQTYAVKHCAGQQFWWWPWMTSSDALLLQIYDSATAARCAHASFEPPGTDLLSTRTSLEARCFILG